MSCFNVRGNLRNALRNYRGRQMVVTIEVWNEKLVKGSSHGSYDRWEPVGKRFVYEDVVVLDYNFFKLPGHNDVTSVGIVYKDCKHSKKGMAQFMIQDQFKDGLRHKKIDSYIDYWILPMSDYTSYLKITKKRHYNVEQMLRSDFKNYQRIFDFVSSDYKAMQCNQKELEASRMSYGLLKCIMMAFSKWAQQVEEKIHNGN